MKFGMVFALALCVSPIIAAAPVGAQSTASSNLRDLLGDWSVETTRFGPDQCQLVGQMTLTTDENGAMSCQLSLQQVCATEGFGPFGSVQACDILAVNSAVLIRSEVLSLDPPDTPYLPDSFDLRLTTPNEMVGRHLSPNYSNIRAKFTRRAQTIS